MLDYEFMRTAFAASGVVGVLAGIVGYFLVLRGQAFAAHALAHVGFTGAAGALLIGAPPLAGMAVATLAAGGLMGVLGAESEARDLAIGIVLAGALGAGLLLLHFAASSAAPATALLFGNVFGTDWGGVAALAGLAAVSLAALSRLARPLLFVSLHPDLAEASGVSPRYAGTLFLLIVALAIAASAQLTGVLLVFVLTVAPAATAQRLSRGVLRGVALAAAIAVADAWGGIAISYATDWPPSAAITGLSLGVYLLARTRGG